MPTIIDRENEWSNSVAATALLLSDSTPKEMDAVYLPGLSKGMIDSGNLCRQVAVVYHDRFNTERWVAFNGSNGEGMGDQNKPGAAWPGKDWYISQLQLEDIPEFRLVPTGPGLHTRGEMDALVALAKERGWKKVVLVTVPYHFVQVFKCLVQAMKAQEYWFAVYASSTETDWEWEMVGSQGLEANTTPFREAGKYAPKVWDYERKGYSAGFPELFVYLANRERFALGELTALPS